MLYRDDNRGKIQYPEQKKQIIDFSKIRYGNITPTDLDGFFEINNQCFVFFEYKQWGKDMPYGQELAMTRIVDALSTAGKKAVLFLCWHNQFNAQEEILADKAIVERFYWQGKWWIPDKQVTVKEKTNNFVKWAMQS